MGRRSKKRPYNQPHRPLELDRLSSVRRSELGPGNEEYQVQQISGSDKQYLCPGCLQTIIPGTGHVVAWRSESIYGTQANLQSRRHWHTNCWRRGLRPN